MQTVLYACLKFAELEEQQGQAVGGESINSENFHKSFRHLKKRKFTFVSSEQKLNSFTQTFDSVMDDVASQTQLKKFLPNLFSSMNQHDLWLFPSSCFTICCYFGLLLKNSNNFLNYLEKRLEM